MSSKKVVPSERPKTSTSQTRGRSPNFLKPTVSSSQARAATPNFSSKTSTTGSHTKARTPNFSRGNTTCAQIISAGVSKEVGQLKASVVPSSFFDNPDATLINSDGEWEQEYDDAYAYNDYLLALMKNQIAKRDLARVKHELGDQLAIQIELLYKDKLEVQRLETEANIQAETEKISAKGEKAQKMLEEFQAACKKSDFEKSLNVVVDVLSGVKDRVVLENVVEGSTDEMVNQLSVVSAELEKLLRSSGSQDKVQDLAEKLQSALCLKEEVIKKDKQTKELLVELGAVLMKTLSDYFAEQFEE